MDLYMHLPADYDRDTTKKHPVLYILDGQWDFRLMDALLAGLDYDRYTPDMILVGVTWSGENADYNTLRTMDFLPPTAGQPSGFGGAPKFLRFLKYELIPFIESNYRADPAQRILQGRSYGGLFTLYALFSDPGLFSGYMASSPAVDYIFGQEAEFAKEHKELPVKVFIGVGSAESFSGPVQEFMRVLRSRGYKGLKLGTRVVEGFGHSSCKAEVFNHALQFMFAK
jgi:predicted alpha/beta superfamily hydrolase